MTTQAIDETSAQPTPAEVRRGEACKYFRDAERKASDLPLRRDRARAEIERLNRELAEAEAEVADADPNRIAELRQERTQQRELLEDLERCGPLVARELELAQAELLMAERACHAERYNVIVTQQLRLTAVLDEAVLTLFEALRKKEDLARVQDQIVGNIMPYAELSPERLRLAYLQYLTDHLQNPIPVKLNWPSLQGLDWSCRHMGEQGNLEECREAWLRRSPEEHHG